MRTQFDDKRLARAIAEKSYEDAARLYVDLKSAGLAGMPLAEVLSIVEATYQRAIKPQEIAAYAKFLANESRLCGLSRGELRSMGDALIAGFALGKASER